MEPVLPLGQELRFEEARQALASFTTLVDRNAGDPILNAWLDDTAHPRFLGALDENERMQWVDAALRAIRGRDHRIEDLLRWRAERHADHTWFTERGSGAPASGWTYAAVRRHVRSVAAALWQVDTRGKRAPRVVLWTANCVEGACADLACLAHDVFVVPLSVHLDDEELQWIVERLDVDAVVTDTDDRVRRVIRLRKRIGRGLEVFALQPGRSVDAGDATLLAERAADFGVDRTATILEARPRLGIDEPCTAMFTSGSTGRPKGVVFTPFHLISKRYCRGAALPTVGRDETLYCFLPLFHTFGRFLEMLGTLYWRGTYVFAGNPSAEALMAAMVEVEPTGLISIPQRWQQIRDAFEVRAESGAIDDLRHVTGGRLRWGLSAAGYLDPRTFRFFHRHGVALCSGFGMTEATGGITMSPPDDYVDDTVGRPLPGIEVRLDDGGEMLVRGAYVARYLSENGSDLELEPTEPGPGGDEAHQGEGWLRTGDVFRELGGAHLQIVDRVKDIYKNSRGQTVAPRRVEDQFTDVPGIRRVFLVGDHRPWNALLVVPDLDDPILRDAPDEISRHEYFGHVIAAANRRLAPFERVVDYALLDRDFDAERGELTPKKSFRRKVITENFASTIEDLYRAPFVQRRISGLDVRLPQWLLRDLNVLEDDIEAGDGVLVDARRGRELVVRRQDDGRVRVGDLAYRIDGDVIDLGRLSRQPDLWLGNPGLLEFVPGKQGWDVPTPGVGDDVALPHDHTPTADFVPRAPADDVDDLVVRANALVQTVLHALPESGLVALEELAKILGQSDLRLDHAIRQRLTTLAWHDDEMLRCEAYRVLLLDEPTARYNEAFGPFIQSGRPFLSHHSIRRIASERFGSRRLEALRQRLAHYRDIGDWPASAMIRQQFLDVLRLLADFARHDVEYYHPVRCELASWALHEADPELAARASGMLDGLVNDFERSLESRLADRSGPTSEQVVFDEDIDEAARQQHWTLLSSKAFLTQSIQLAFNEPSFDPGEIAPGGLWISTAGSTTGPQVYFRWSVRTRGGRHYQLFVIVRRDLGTAQVIETNYRMLAIGGHPFGERVLARFGCARPELGAMSLEYVDDLSVEEQIRRAVGHSRTGSESPDTLDWRRTYVRGMGAVIAVWARSGRRLVPRVARTNNVVVPVIDFREGARVLSLAGWQAGSSARDLFVPLWKGFYPRVIAQAPECGSWIDPRWIVEATVEALGPEAAEKAIEDALADALPSELREALEAGRRDGAIEAHLPLALELAIERFRRWAAINPAATLDAQIDQIEALIRLYHLERHGERVRAQLFRHTCFARSDDRTRAAFDALLATLDPSSRTSITQRVELSELLGVLDDDHRRALARMVFPHRRSRDTVEVLTFGEPGHERVTVTTRVEDRDGRHYTVREPIGAEEVGQVYRVFYREHFARAASESDRFLVTLDRDERVVAAMIYREESTEVTHVDGIVVRSSLQGRGLASALLEDFCSRAAGRGRGVVKTSFVMRAFCEKRGFRADRRWGGLVRFLDGTADTGENDPDVSDTTGNGRPS